MVEHPVEHDPDVTSVSGLEQRNEVGLGTQPWVDDERVGDVVPVAQRREHRCQQEPTATEVLHVVEPCRQLPHRLGRS
jgi:hypothetical protein